MASPDEKVLLTLNGEIYNAFDYKKELTEWGYSFKSTTDTEIVLALYLKYGFRGMIDRLNGMFAIVIADLREAIDESNHADLDQAYERLMNGSFNHLSAFTSYSG